MPTEIPSIVHGSRRVAVVAIALLGVPGLALAQSVPADCTVEAVTDGDTIRCGGERVRLLLIDAPEIDQGPFGRAAQAFLEAVLPVGAAARLALDIEPRDRYGRLLAYVHRYDGQMVNAMMARQGFAVPLVIPPNVRHVEMIRAAADSARIARIGLWSIDAFECAPQDYRDGRCSAEMEDADSAIGASPARDDCDGSYPDVCILSPPPDLDCRDVDYRRFRVIGADPHRFDGDRDGIGCE